MRPAANASSPPTPALTVAALEAAIDATTPEARFAEDYLLRRAVRTQRHITGLRTLVPHTHAVALPTATLASIATPDELGRPLPDAAWTLLLARPDPGDLAATPPDRALRAHWRLLFHVALDRALLADIASGALDAPRARALATELGPLAFEEARAVLADENLIDGDPDPLRDLVELVATWHELHAFAPAQLARWFPSLVGRPAVADLMDSLVDAAALLLATRPAGAPDAPHAARDAALPHISDEPLSDGDLDTPNDLHGAAALLTTSARHHQAGRDVAAALAGFRARRAAPGRAALAEAAALTSLGARLDALAPAVTPSPPSDWVAALTPLLPRARWGMARVEARLLYDLEKACLGAERVTMDVDIGRWLRSFGRAPLRRTEHVHAAVGVVQSLARAAARVNACGLDEAAHRRLARLLDGLHTAAQADLHSRVGRLLAQALSEAGIIPRSVPERVAHDQVIAQLLNLLLTRGFLGLQDFRDIIAKNQLKLPNLTNPREFISGDPLLALDRAAARLLDGAYRRGEAYRRGLQRLSSLFFATRLGRLLVRFLILPIGGSYLLLQGLEHMLGPLVRAFDPARARATLHAAATEVVQNDLPSLSHKVTKPHHPEIFWSIPSFIIVAALLFILLHSPQARALTQKALRTTTDTLHLLFIRLPRRFVAWRPIATFLHTRPIRWLWRRLLRPALAVTPLVLLAALLSPYRYTALAVGLPLTLGASFFLNSRRGERFSESFIAALGITWRGLVHELIPGLIDVVMRFFKRLMDQAEIALYTVDQWLRYRSGDRAVLVPFKAVLGLVWRIFAYITRFMVNLVAEPQINPIKHFPVVTVSHKLTIPLTLLIAHQLHPILGAAAANIIGALAQFIIPGICGFLVWEFKENWKLYRQNRPATLRPVALGSHGETLQRLVRLGFHSGTLPRLFRKLRSAERRENAREIRHHTDALRHVEEAIARFILGELKPLLIYSERFPEAADLRVVEVRLSPARIAVDLALPAFGAPATLTFDERSGVLLGGILRPGFLATLAPHQAAAFTDALDGIYRLAGVAITRADLYHHLPGLPTPNSFQLSRRGLTLTLPDFRTEAFYPLARPAPLLTPVLRGDGPLVAPTLPSSALRLQERPITWTSWVKRWSPTP